VGGVYTAHLRGAEIEIYYSVPDFSISLIHFSATRFCTIELPKADYPAMFEINPCFFSARGEA
jgi:hypothetical protein